MDRAKTSRQKYRQFVEDYKAHRLDELIDAQNAALARAGQPAEPPPKQEEEVNAKGKKPRLTKKRRAYIKLYLQWLKPHRGMLSGVILFAILLATFEMIEPLFMRTIIDDVLLNKAIDTTTQFQKLNLIGGVFLAFIIISKMIQVAKDYRQRILNTRVVLSLRRAPHRRRGDDDGTPADGGNLAVAVDPPPPHRPRHPPLHQLAARPHGPRRDSGRDVHLVHRLQAGAPHL
jgi:ATP-binding cassette subfamily B protein